MGTYIRLLFVFLLKSDCLNLGNKIRISTVSSTIWGTDGNEQFNQSLFGNPWIPDFYRGGKNVNRYVDLKAPVRINGFEIEITEHYYEVTKVELSFSAETNGPYTNIVVINDGDAKDKKFSANFDVVARFVQVSITRDDNTKMIEVTNISFFSNFHSDEWQRIYILNNPLLVEKLNGNHIHTQKLNQSGPKIVLIDKKNDAVLELAYKPAKRKKTLAALFEYDNNNLVFYSPGNLHLDSIVLKSSSKHTMYFYGRTALKFVGKYRLEQTDALDLQTDKIVMKIILNSSIPISKYDRHNFLIYYKKKDDIDFKKINVLTNGGIIEARIEARFIKIYSQMIRSDIRKDDLFDVTAKVFEACGDSCCHFDVSIYIRIKHSSKKVYGKDEKAYFQCEGSKLISETVLVCADGGKFIDEMSKNEVDLYGLCSQPN